VREGYGRALAKYGEVNPNVVVLDPDTSGSTFTHFFSERFPERFFNIGIAEPCMVDVAVGLALGGKIPFANGFAALIALRAMEQVRTCVCYARTSVKLVGHFAGLSDFKDGPTHHSITDLANMRAMPELTVIVPADAAEAAQWVPIIAEYDGPVYLRISRASALPAYREGTLLTIGKGITLREGSDLTLVAIGSMVGRTLVAADNLAQKGVHARVLEIHTLKPLDRDLILQAAEETGALVAAEEHSILGGLGSAVAETLSTCRPTILERVGIADTFTRTAFTPEILMDAFGLSVQDIESAAQRALVRKS
jgi:transketolase